MEKTPIDTVNENTNKESSSASTHPEFWMGLEHYNNDAEFMQAAQNEFLRSPLSEDDSPVARRDFLKLMTASVALASTACLRRPAQKIVPYVKQPEQVVPGVANFYASTYVDGGEVYGMLVKTREGRPIKLEGNDLHPVNQGALTARAQAHLLSLYDPDRAREPVRVSPGEGFKLQITWDELDKKVSPVMKTRMALLTSSMVSPSARALVDELSKKVKLKHYEWEPLCLDSVRQGQKHCYADDVVPRYRLDKAHFILTIGADPLGTFLSPAEFNRQFASGRNPDGKMNKLVAVEGGLSLTGCNADTRIRVRPSQFKDFVLAVAHEIIVVEGKTRYAGDAEVKAHLAKYANASRIGVSADDIKSVAKGLIENMGSSLVLAGGLSSQVSDALSLQVAVNFLNSSLDNDGKTIDYQNSPVTSHRGSHMGLDDLIATMQDGRLDTLFIQGVNPGYSLGKDSGFHAALKKVKTVVYLGDRVDETGELANYIALDHHPMESWGDAEVQRGVYSIQQPTIRPLYNTRAWQDSLITWATLSGVSLQANNWHEYLKGFWKNNLFGKSGSVSASSFESFWNKVLQDGVFDTVGEKRNAVSSGRSFDKKKLTSVAPSAVVEGFELELYAKVGIGDGSMANVSWLQELPDPVTKIVWDNYLNISPAKAKELNLKQDDVVELTVGEIKREVPVHVQPGQHDETLSLAVGYGRNAAGAVGNRVGVAAFDLASWNSGKIQTAGLSAKIKKLNKTSKLGNVQTHHLLDDGHNKRQIVTEATLDQYKQNPAAGIHKHPVNSIWSGHKYTTHKWGMTIDLNKCTGCAACVVACQSENNIPVVGKKYVLQGREMHWLRIDRYYKGEPSNPDTVFQPMLCQHCDNAPCESVCPVVATSHSDEGLNEMTYNRCVGTRYCANNCPYKVRRFNWFNYSKVNAVYKTENNSPLALALNPEVTVRSRGVMEKCTFCVQRILDGKGKAKDEERSLKDGDIVTACQQTCPTKAITFGDTLDKASAVVKEQGSPRCFAVLEEFNAAPAIRYQTKIRNATRAAEDHHHKEEGHHS